MATRETPTRGSATRETLEEVRNHKRAVESDAQDAIGHIRAIGGTLQDNIRSIAYEAGQKVGDMVSTGRAKFDEVSDEYASTVREKPMQATLIALGVGVLAGLLLFRRSR